MIRVLSSRARYIFGALIVVCIGVTLTTDVGRALTSPVRALIRPIAGFVSLWAQSWHERTRAKEELVSENVFLREEATRLTIALRDAYVCREELTELRTLVHYEPSSPYHTIAARIVSYTSPHGMRVLIDKGARHGITVGAAAVAGEGVLMGRVVAVESEFSEVALLADDETNIAARIAVRQVEGILRVDQGRALVLDLIPSHVLVAVGDTVLTTGLDERVPRDLVIGAIADVAHTEGSSFLTLAVRPSLAPLLPHLLLIIVPSGG